MSGPFRVWLGLGGNIGDVVTSMASALQLLDDLDDLRVSQVSKVYKTPPWGNEDQPWFLNCCAEIETSLQPEQLLETCQMAEKAGKRERLVRWGPRTIDIDILIFEGIEQAEQRLTIPHPRIAERAFVLVPLADIAPDLVLDGISIIKRSVEIDTLEIEEAGLPADWWQGSKFS